MQTLHQAMLLKKMYLLQALGFAYFDPIFFAPKSKNFSIKDSQSLNHMVKNCMLCSKKTSLSNVGLCNPHSKLTFISLFPLLDSNLRFNSKSGEMLQKIIQNVFKLPLSQVSILSLLKCEIPKNEIENSLESCASYFFKQLEFSHTKIIVALGADAYFYFTKDGSPYENIRGKVLEWQKCLLFPTFSLLDLLRNPALKTQAHKDFITLKGYL